MQEVKYLVKEELVRSQVVSLIIPDGLLVDGAAPPYDHWKRDEYDEYVTERVYLEAASQGRWDTSTKDTDWDDTP